MSLGPDHHIAKQAFVDAMRPIAGDNVNVEQVQANLGALGAAVYEIATAHAETLSSPNTDADFWQWIAAVQDWMVAVAAWQNSVHQSLSLLDPGLTATVPEPPLAPVPTRMQGQIE